MAIYTRGKRRARKPTKEDRLSLVFGALADPTRRAMLEELSAAPRSVGELAAPHAMSLAAASKHIQMLERAALVQRRRVGREHFLSFQPRAFDEVARWIDSVDPESVCISAP